MVVSTPYGDLRHGEVSATVGCTPYIYRSSENELEIQDWLP